MRFRGVRIRIDGREEKEGYVVRSDHYLLQSFCVIEEKDNTDFSLTKKILAQFLDVNFQDGAPHQVEFDPAEPGLMIAHGYAEVYIETKPLLH